MRQERHKQQGWFEMIDAVGWWRASLGAMAHILVIQVTAKPTHSEVQPDVTLFNWALIRTMKETRSGRNIQCEGSATSLYLFWKCSTMPLSMFHHKTAMSNCLKDDSMAVEETVHQSLNYSRTVCDRPVGFWSRYWQSHPFFDVEFIGSVDVRLMIGEVEEIGLWILTQTTCPELMLETWAV